MQTKLILLAVVGGLLAAMGVQSFISTSRLAKAKARVDELAQQLQVSEQTKLAEREAYREAMELVASVRESEQRLSSLSQAINHGVAQLGEAHEKIDPCFYTIPDPITIDGLYTIPKNSTR